MVVAWKEIAFRGGEHELLVFSDGTTAFVVCTEQDSHDTLLEVRYSNGAVSELRNTVDTSELIDSPRIFVFQGSDQAEVLIFGGEVACYLRSDGAMQYLPTFRAKGGVEYWRTK